MPSLVSLEHAGPSVPAVHETKLEDVMYYVNSMKIKLTTLSLKLIAYHLLLQVYTPFNFQSTVADLELNPVVRTLSGA